MNTKLFEPSDLESTLKITEEFIINNLENDNYNENWLTQDFYERILLGKTEEKFDTIITRNNDIVLGFIIGAPFSPIIYEIRQHYVAEGYRGRRIAKKQKEFLTQLAKDRGIS